MHRTALPCLLYQSENQYVILKIICFIRAGIGLFTVEANTTSTTAEFIRLLSKANISFSFGFPKSEQLVLYGFIDTDSKLIVILIKKEHAIS